MFGGGGGRAKCAVTHGVSRGGVSVVYIHMLVLWERGDCSKLNVYAHEQEGELAKSTKSERMCLMDFLQVARR